MMLCSIILIYIVGLGSRPELKIHSLLTYTTFIMRMECIADTTLLCSRLGTCSVSRRERGKGPQHSVEGGFQGEVRYHFPRCQV